MLPYLLITCDQYVKGGKKLINVNFFITSQMEMINNEHLGKRWAIKCGAEGQVMYNIITCAQLSRLDQINYVLSTAIVRTK
jgi:hypothetical protein